MKTILVIGGSTGIGQQLVQNLSLNHQVISTYCNTSIESSENIHYQHFDVIGSDVNSLEIPEKIDGLVYCVGAIQLKPFHRITTDDFTKDYQKQVLGAIKIIQHCLPNLKLSENPSIVLFSTVAVQLGFPFHSMVASSKGAIEGFTKALAAELAPKIRVNCIAPSITNTPLAAGLLNTDEKIAANAQRHPLKKIGQPNDVAKMAEFLLSDDAAWITGQILHVDGGMSTLKI